MSTTSYSYTSTRSIYARWNRQSGSAAQISTIALAGLTAVMGAALLLIHHHIGVTFLGISTLAGVLTTWQYRDIRLLAAPLGALTANPVQLDQVLEGGLLSYLDTDTTAAQVFEAALQQWEGRFIAIRLLLPIQVIIDTLHQRHTGGDAIWQQAIDLAQQFNLTEIDSGVVVCATLLITPELAPVLAHLKIVPEDIITVLDWQQRAKLAIRSQKGPVDFGGIGRDWANGYTPLLNRFATNMSHEVEGGYYRHLPTVHREAVDRLITQLSENRASALVGGVGSGRTSIVYSMAERMLSNDNVGGLQYYQVMSLNASVLISAGGKLEDIMLELLSEAVHARNIIIFLDEAQLFFNTGPGAVDLAQILLPIIQRNAIKLVCAMSDHDWQTLTVRQPALIGSLQRLVIPEPHPAETLKVVQDAALGIEAQTNTTVVQEAVAESIRLAGRYLPEAAFPGKAITVLTSAAHYAVSGIVTAAAVQQAVQATTGAKVVAASQPERQQLLDLENQIHQHMINQTRAVKVVSDALRRSRAGVSSPKRPVGSFLFLGPTGVGKTELAKALAAIYYGGPDALIRLDMSEYQQQADISRLLAPSTGTQTGVTLASGVRQRPSSVVLLDEIEKAHPDVLNLLLQLLDEGSLTDTDGRQVSFKDAIIIATSNAAADEIRQRIAAGQSLESFEGAITEQLITDHVFKPELLNRFDEIVLFRPLTKPELRQVVELMLAEVNATLDQQQVKVAVTAAAADWLVEHGYDPQLGARPLRRMVQRTVENIVAERLLAGTIIAGQSVTLDVTDLVPAAATTPPPSL